MNSEAHLHPLERAGLARSSCTQPHGIDRPRIAWDRIIAILGNLILWGVVAFGAVQLLRLL